MLNLAKWRCSYQKTHRAISRNWIPEFGLLSNIIDLDLLGPGKEVEVQCGVDEDDKMTINLVAQVHEGGDASTTGQLGWQLSLRWKMNR